MPQVPDDLPVRYSILRGIVHEGSGNPTHLSTNVMLSAISATRFAILLAMMAYADVTPPPPVAGLSPATDAALGATPFGARLAAVPVDGFLTGARGAAGLRDTPFMCGAV